MKHRTSLKYLLIAGAALLAGACSPDDRTLENIKKRGALKILTVNSETTLYEGREGKTAGFEFDLASAFAEELGVAPRFIVKDSLVDVFDAFDQGEGDLIAAGVSITSKREQKYAFTESYFEVQQQLVCKEGVNPESLEEVQKLELVVGARSSYEERLSNLKEEFEGLSWEVTHDKTTHELILQLRDEEYDCTVADSNIVQIYRRYFPNLNVSVSLGTPQHIAWVLHPEQAELLHQANQWIDKNRDGLIKNLKDNHYSFSEDFDPFDIKKFTKRIESRLPKYKATLQKAAEEFGWEWTLLAAIAYQESQWNPRAKSPTGVRGFMMLTQSTAKAMGVDNRMDAEASIVGGARYLRKLEERIPKYIPNPDRKWMALASYNVGFSHLRDARGLAAWRDKNPNRWSGVRSVLPLLSRKKVYKRLPHGYARGLEPVLYVDRIRNYLTILRRHLKN